MRHPLVSIILVNWNGKRHLASCLQSLHLVRYVPTEIILVDNASTDGSAEWAKAKYTHITLVKNNENLGFAGGHDAGFSEARGAYILLLNVDTVVEPLFLGPLVDRLERDHTIGVIQPKVVLEPDRRVIDSVGSFFLGNGLLYHFGREKDEKLPEYNIPFDIFSAKGACMLIRREVVSRVGLFDSDYFAYFEETDFCMRVMLAGWRICYEPSSRVYHAGGGASSQHPAAHIVYHSSKNVICTYIKNLSVLNIVRIIPRILALYAIWVISSVLTGRLRTAWAVIRGIWWNAYNINATLEKRRRTQSIMRVRPDDAFLPGLMHPVRLQYYWEQFFGNLGRYQDIPIAPQRSI
ncbi:MAG: glycosyltransferase family 2 protein [bacterium]|nr:glycosyltransferase family 2 protein [bacterium]